MSKGRNSSSVSIWLDDQLIILVNRRAAAKGLSRSEWIARLIKRELGIIKKV